jgi:3-hydroxybutyryl-CoA dehydrogenase
MAASTIGVIGAGIMGSGIAQLAASKGLNVILVDVNDSAVKKGIEGVNERLARLVSKGKVTTSDKETALQRIKGRVAYDELKPAEIVIEAATEDFNVKAKILKQIDQIIGPNAIIASNTSSLSITKLGSIISRPERFVGLHFFNPVPIMSLVEIVRGLQTSDTTYDSVAALVEQLGKSPIKVKSAPGFVVNRILLPMINEAFFVLEEGYASAADIDQGMKLGCNHPVGPLALADMIGLDVLLSVMQIFHDEFADSKYRPCPLLKELVAAGRLGRKSGHGVYSYN